MSKAITIKAVVYWAQLEEKNDLSEKYQVDLGQLTDAAVEALESLGIDVKFDENLRGNYITCKSSRPIFAKDEDGASLKGIRVGNGSEAVGVVGTYEWKFKGKPGLSPSLNQLVITSLMEYTGDDAGPIDLDEAL